MMFNLVSIVLIFVSAAANGLWLYVSIRKLKMAKIAEGRLILVKDDEDGETYWFLELDNSAILETGEYITLKIERK